MKGYGWDAGDYARHSSAQRDWARELIAKLALQGDECVLDIGCGDGEVSAEIASAVPAGFVAGIDSSLSMVRLARSRQHFAEIANLDCCLADALDLPFRAAFDVVFSNAVLHWVHDHRRVLAGIRRILRPGGRMLLQMGGTGNAAEILRLAAGVMQEPQWVGYFADFVFPYAFYGPEDYLPWLEESGLHPLRVELIPKDMTHQGASELEGWIRTTWLPYTERVPEELRGQFVRQLAASYLARHPLDGTGRAHVAMVRLEVEAVN
jgi:trans-aconitate 2-methyltransferase